MAKGLGKGLDALLGDSSLQAQQEGQGSFSLPISQVQPGLNQPRKRFEQEALDELTESVRTYGVVQPLTVRRLSSGYYQIIAGERRWRAAKAAGLKEVPAVVIEADDRKVMEIGLIENLQREDLNPIEEAKGYKSLIDDYGMTQEDISLRMGKSRPAITNALRLLELPDAVLQLLEEGRLSAGHGRAILSAHSKSDQRSLAQRVIDEGLSVRQTEALAKKLSQVQKEPTKKQSEDPNKIYRDEVARNMSKKFGRRVSIIHGAKKGKVELEYYDESDLMNLLDILDRSDFPLPKGGSRV